MSVSEKMCQIVTGATAFHGATLNLVYHYCKRCIFNPLHYK